VLRSCSKPGVQDTDFGNLKDLESLEGIGACGKYPNHMHKELLGVLGMGSLPVSQISLRVKQIGKPWTKNVMQAILWPHLLFSAIFHNFPAAFKKRIAPSADALEEFWDAMEDHPSLQGDEGAELKSVENWKRKAVPITIHGDEVPVTGCGKSWSKSQHVLSWGSMLGKGSTIQRTFLIIPLMVALLAHTGVTADILWRGIVWSLRALQKGKHPTQDMWGNIYPPASKRGKLAGKPLCGEAGFFGHLLGILGDLEHLWKHIKLACYNSGDPCCFCPCNSSNIPWRDFTYGKGNKWVPLIYTLAAWMAAFPNPHVLFSLPGVTIFSVLTDILHVKHLGTDEYFYASVLWLLCFRVLPGTHAL